MSLQHSFISKEKLSPKTSGGYGLVALLVVIAILALVFFGVRAGDKEPSHTPILEQGIDATENAAGIRDAQNARNESLDDLINEL